MRRPRPGLTTLPFHSLCLVSAVLTWPLIAAGHAAADEPAQESADTRIAERAAKENTDAKKPRPVFAFLALNTSQRPTEEELREALDKSFSEDATLLGVEIDEKSVQFNVNGRQIMAVNMGVPIPWRDLELPCAESLLWREATQVMKSHKDHLIVLLSNADPDATIADSVHLTKSIAALSRCFDAAGIYWGHGPVVTSPSRLQEFAAKASPESPPVLLWTAIHRSRGDQGGLTVTTTGLEYFGLLDIEIIDSNQSPKEVFAMVSGVAFICLQGKVIKDGDTVGPSADVKIKAYHRPSSFNPEKTVLFIDY